MQPAADPVYTCVQAVRERLLHALGLFPSPPAAAPAPAAAPGVQEAQAVQARCLRGVLMHLHGQLSEEPRQVVVLHSAQQQQQQQQQQQEQGATKEGKEGAAAPMECDTSAAPTGAAADRAPQHGAHTPARHPTASSSASPAQRTPGLYAALLWGAAAGQNGAGSGPPSTPLALAVLRVHGASAAQVLLALPLLAPQSPQQGSPRQGSQQDQQVTLQLLGLLGRALRDAGVARLLVHAVRSPPSKLGMQDPQYEVRSLRVGRASGWAA